MADLKFNTKFEPKTISVWSRCHSPGRNYLLIEEEIQIQTTYKTGVKYSQSRGQSDLESYEFDKSDMMRADKFIENCMSPANVATKEYEYFRVLYANGTDIICKNHKEFKQILKQTK